MLEIQVHDFWSQVECFGARVSGLLLPLEELVGIDFGWIHRVTLTFFSVKFGIHVKPVFWVEGARPCCGWRVRGWRVR